MSKLATPEYAWDPRGWPIIPPPYGVWKDGILWNSQSVGKLQNNYDPSILTVTDLWFTALAKFGNRPSAGTRELISRDMVEDPKDKKKYEKLTLGDYSWLTYAQWGERARHFGSGLMEFSGLKPKDRVVIYAETQRDWMTAALACWNHNLTVVTSYATLGADAAAFAVNQTKATAVIADAKLLPVLLKVHQKCPALRTVISISAVKAEDKQKLEEASVRVAEIEELIAAGKAKEVEVVKPDRMDLAIIMFTSGTTGNPKGVMLTHSALICATTGMALLMDRCVTANDVYIAYLPLAHIMEIAAELTMIAYGCSLGFGNPHTLTNTGVKLATGQLGDLVVLRPTIVIFAPLVLEKIYNGIQARVASGGAFKQFLFNKAVESGLHNFEHGEVGASYLWNLIVLKKIQDMIGGRVRLIVTGSAPLDPNVHKFVQACFACPVRQGYGATETSAASVTQEICDNSAGVVGPPRASCCIKLVDWEEGNYRFSDKDDPKIGCPRGEIAIGGELVALGYLVDEADPDPELVEKNSTDFRTDENGLRWFYTGDIGQVDANGSLKIIDRKKDLVKLQQGEYVALSKVEGVLKLSPFVENALVEARPSQKFCVALICPSVPSVVRWCKEQNIPHDDLEAVVTDGRLVAAVYKSIQEQAKGKLSGFEIPEKISLVPPSRTWTPENDLLTAAMKLKRKPIITAHKEQLDKLYV